MSIVEGKVSAPPKSADGLRSGALEAGRSPRDLQQSGRLILATAWLLDAVLQLQPFMFIRGPDGFSGMLAQTAGGNPSWIAHSITWNASMVDHHPVLTNSLFATIQLCLGFGIAWRRTVRAALVLSVAWSLAVWWFGEGLGAILRGGATPLGGGPGGVLFYALIAVLLWPVPSKGEPYIAARVVGKAAARAIWMFVWMTFAVLSVVGSGRSPEALRDLVVDMERGEPGWMVRLDRLTEPFMFHHGATTAVLFAIFCTAVAAGIYLPPRGARVVLGLVMLVFAAIWIGLQNCGGVLTGTATDPNSGPAIILLALMYWPLRDMHQAVPIASHRAAWSTQGSAA